MSFFSNLGAWLSRLFGGRPTPTQALREDLARHPPSGKGPQKTSPTPPKTEATPYQRPTPAPSGAPASEASGEVRAASGPEAPLPPIADRPAASPQNLADSTASAGERLRVGGFSLEKIRAEAEAQALAIPEPQTPLSRVETGAEGPLPAAPPSILPPLTLLAPPRPATAEIPAAPPLETPAGAPPVLEHSSSVNVSLSEAPQPEGMTLDLAPAAPAPAAPPPPQALEEEDQEGLVDLSFVDEDMQELDARALGRARPLLAPPPLDMLVARWRAILARRQGKGGVWALFKHGTVAIFPAAPRNAEAEARDMLKTQGPARYGAPEPEVTALPNGAGWLVGGSDPRIFTYVAPEEAGVTTPVQIIGRLGRAKREEDARDLQITHIENDPFWRPPED